MSLQGSAREGIYRGVRVSRTDWNFSRHEHEDVPRELLREWAGLVVEVARIFDETFEVPPFPESLAFSKELIHSDGPYPSDENYYTLDEYRFMHKGEDGRGVLVTFEKYRQGGDDPLCVETYNAKTPVSSGIAKRETAPVAYLIVTTILSHPTPAQLDAADAAVRRHHLHCGGTL